jgi:hypothetical protein
MWCHTDRKDYPDHLESSMQAQETGGVQQVSLVLLMLLQL